MDLTTLALTVTLLTVEEMWRMQWKRKIIGTQQETRCHLWKNVLKEFDLVRFKVSFLLVLYA